MEQELLKMLESLSNQINLLSAETKASLEKLSAETMEIKVEVTKINVKLENKIEPNIRLLAEAHSLNAGTRKDVQEIKQKVHEMDINVKALMDVVPEHSLKIEELKKRA